VKNKTHHTSQSQPSRFKRLDWPLIGILLIALVLYGYGTWKTGSANDFYTSAITSMTQSFKNFWYASFDPAGYITVDKPPVALWFMAISAKMLGVSNFSVVLPSVLFGVGSVYLMYRLVKPTFGVHAGRIAALVMTITPIVVADSRTNNMDATLIYFLLLAIWMLQKAIHKNQHRFIWLVGSFALIGFAFNIKMLQAFMILPGMLLFYWLASRDNWKFKIGKLAVATVALIGFTLAWPLSVDMTAANQRPYEGGSQHNSVLELAFGYNGTQRLLGQTTGTGGAFKNNSGSNGKKISSNPMNGRRFNPKNLPTNMSKNHQHGNFKPGKMGRHGGGMGGAGGAFNIGTAGPLRLFQSALGPQISWFLPFAIFGILAAFWRYADPTKKWYQLTLQQKHVVLWSGWLVPVYGFFSVASFFHPYYTIMLAPAIAALSGIGLVAMLQLFKNAANKIAAAILPIAIITTATLQAWYVSSYYTGFSILILGSAVIFTSAFLLTKHKKIGRLMLILGLLTITIAPSFWSATPTIAQESAAIPTSGPDLLSSQGNNSGGIGNGTVNSGLLKYLQQHQGNAKYLFATADSGTAAPYIIKTKTAVMAMGGFNGTDPAMTLTKFKQLVKSGQVKYYLDAGKSGSTNQTIVKWIQKHARKVAASAYGNNHTASNRHRLMNGPNNNNTLYDLSHIY
jgi:4-amino-4-deoxy-L-arabinose transferase-like glycosyltransferase